MVTSTSSSCLSLVSLYGAFLRRSLTAVGLSSQTIAIDNSTTVHLWAPKEKPADQKPHLLLIHGFGPPGAWQWRRQLAPFANHFNLYIPDLVCFGESHTNLSERSEIFQAEVIAKLMEKLGVERYCIVGTSYGGFVANRIAEKYPKRVDKVVIASSGINTRPRNHEELLKRAGVEKIEEVMLPTTPRQLRTLMRLAAFRSPYLPDFILNDVINKLYSENRDELLELLKGLTLGRSDTVDIFPLQQEVLLIWGEHDQIFPVEMANELKELLGKKVKLEVIKNASHLPQIEQSKQFNNLVLNFFIGL